MHNILFSQYVNRSFPSSGLTSRTTRVLLESFFFPFYLLLFKLCKPLRKKSHYSKMFMSQSSPAGKQPRISNKRKKSMGQISFECLGNLFLPWLKLERENFDEQRKEGRGGGERQGGRDGGERRCAARHHCCLLCWLANKEARFSFCSLF